MQAEPIQVQVNGEPHASEALNVSGLLEELQLDARQVAVEVNEELVPRGNHATHSIHSGDQIEVVRLVGGG